MGAGSVFNKDIPNNNLSIGRAYQINKKNKKINNLCVINDYV